MWARDCCRVWWPTLAVVWCNPPSLWTGWSSDKWHLDTGPWSLGHDQQSAAGGLHGGSGQPGEADPPFWTHLIGVFTILGIQALLPFTYIKSGEWGSWSFYYHDRQHCIVSSAYWEYKQYRNWNSLVQRFMILMQCCRDSNSLSSISKYLTAVSRFLKWYYMKVCFFQIPSKESCVSDKRRHKNTGCSLSAGA